jgi:hypothetical protein
MKLLKAALLALLVSLVLGLVIGTALRLRLEQSVYYLGSAIAPHPLDVSDTRPSILDARHYEEQIGQAV